MKFVLLFAIIVACIGGQVWACSDDACLTHAAVEKCKDEQNISEEQLGQLKDGAFDDGQADENVMCFVKCVLDEFDALDGDVLKPDVFNDYFEPLLGSEKTEQLYDECKDEAGDGECEIPFKIVTCLRKRDDIFKF
ncbi:uncharacterized protein LOC129939419 [Eupeodes corollae]|uniref:uncharacterized protein LOC129939419 n=1 Tax=Eupeodes corollae TaxID=290404 RepID=UPI0024905524|nr:uncharacterized protein LOC129939419 [Eupeodes corollae]